MNWYLKCLKEYPNFKGRASRSEYWFFVLFNILFSIAASVIDSVLGLTGSIGVGTLYSLAMFIPGLAVATRRFHDTGRSGLQIVICYVAVFVGAMMMGVGAVAGIISAGNESAGGAAAGGMFALLGMALMAAAGIYALVILVLGSTPGDNKYGPPAPSAP